VSPRAAPEAVWPPAVSQSTQLQSPELQRNAPARVQCARGLF